ncbi:MAG: pseudouridine synthase [Bacteroidota bacterium]|nr:pseudouridine synthase [Bacteroidota bacterium]
MICAFNKPYGVVCQFTATVRAHRTLAEFGFPPRVYPIGRLDRDSEGLLLLSDEAGVNTLLLDPRYGHKRSYFAQVEGIPPEDALEKLRQGVQIGSYRTRPCSAHVLVPQPDIPERTPPIRRRHHIPTCWIEIVLTEGKNRQVRRMTASVGHPTLRLIRMRIESIELGDLKPGKWRILTDSEHNLLLGGTKPL